MSGKARILAQSRAIELGRRAFIAGTPKEECPYKVSEWGLGFWWMMGWNKAQTETEKLSGAPPRKRPAELWDERLKQAKNKE